MGIKEKYRKVRKRNLCSIAIIILFSLFLLSCTTVENRNNKEIQELLLLGNNHVMSEQYEEAITSYRSVLSLDPNTIEGLYGLAHTYLLDGQLDESAKAILLVSQADTKNSYSLKKTYANLLYDSGEIEKSLTFLDDLFHSNPYDKELAMLLIERYLEHEFISKAYEIGTTSYTYHYKDTDLIKKIAQVAQKGNLPSKESWTLLVNYIDSEK